jgi:3,4-dihydroxy-2-butanone 4-phosphate synthase
MKDQQDHVIELVNQVNAVLAGEELAETATTLTLSVICHIVATSDTPENRLVQAREFARQVNEYIRREDIIEWVKNSVTYIQRPKKGQ